MTAPIATCCTPQHNCTPFLAWQWHMSIRDMYEQMLILCRTLAKCRLDPEWSRSNMCADGIPHGRQLLQSPRPWRALLLQGGRQSHQGTNSLHHWGNEAHEWNRGDGNCHLLCSCSFYSIATNHTKVASAAGFAHAVCVAYSVQSVRMLLLLNQVLLCWPYRRMWVELLSSGLSRMGLRLLLDR